MHTASPMGVTLDSLAVMLGHDPFALFTELADSQPDARPEQRAAMAAALAGSFTVAAQTAALGYVLDADERVSAVALEALVEAARRQRPARSQIARLRRLLPWLPPKRRDIAQAALEAIGPGEAVADPPAAVPRRVLSTLCDGGGAWTLFVLAKRGSMHAMASMLGKAGRGIIYAMVDPKIARTDADAMLRQASQAMELRPTAPASAVRRIAHALSENEAAGTPPPFGLLLCCELLDIVPPAPRAVAAADLAAELLEGLPAAQTGAEAAAEAQRAWPKLRARHPILASWFEDPDEPEVRRLLARRAGPADRAQALLAQRLPARRAFWAGQCAWSAASLREGARPMETDWRDLALIARDLAGDAPLETMPFAQALAAASVEVAGGRRRARR